MKTLVRYWLLQIPGILLVSVALAALQQNAVIGAATAWAALGLWLLKDMALYPLYRAALGPPPPMGPQALVGQLATAQTEIAERGMVHIRGELWQAHAPDGPIRSGTRVQVIEARGLHLIVRRAAPSSSLGDHRARPR